MCVGVGGWVNGAGATKRACCVVGGWCVCPLRGGSPCCSSCRELRALACLPQLACIAQWRGCPLSALGSQSDAHNNAVPTFPRFQQLAVINQTHLSLALRAGGELRLDVFKQVVAVPSLDLTGFAWDWSAFSNGAHWRCIHGAFWPQWSARACS